MNRLIIALLGSVLYSGTSMAQKQTYFTNPVIHGDVADPSILRIDDTYYATGTSSEWAPYYPVFTSKDLVNWKQTGHVFEQQPEWTKSSFWAPEWYYHKASHKPQDVKWQVLPFPYVLSSIRLPLAPFFCIGGVTAYWLAAAAAVI